MTVVKPETLTPSEAPDGFPSGFTCPRCGGGIWEIPGEALSFQCRIGHKLSLAAMLAEAAALNRRIAGYAQERGHTLSAERLHHEANALEQRSGQLMRMAISVLVDSTQA